MFKQYLRREPHRAARFYLGISPADAEALCLELNQGRDGAGDMAVFNGSSIFIIGPHRASPLVVEPGNWILVKPDMSLDVRSDEDFCQSFCVAAK